MAPVQPALHVVGHQGSIPGTSYSTDEELGVLVNDCGSGISFQLSVLRTMYFRCRSLKAVSLLSENGPTQDFEDSSSNSYRSEGYNG
jgi:hypothetical protein